MKSIARTGVHMADIARRAGVSTATVSRVLNGSERVRPDRRERVLAAVEHFGYRPNRLARSFRRQQAETIGIVVSDIENPHFTTMVRAVEDFAYARGWRVLLCNSDEKPEKQRAYLEMMATERVQGVILSPSNPGGKEIAQLLDSGIHVVAFDRPVDDPRADAVLVDNVRGAARATRHLLDAGHTRVGHVAGPHRVQTGADRQAGYERAMAERDLPARSWDGGFRIDGGSAATHRLLADAPDLTALVLANNLMAIGALQVLRQAGLRVPGDLAMVTIDDAFWSALVEPALTTLAQPLREMSQAAIDLLFERVEGGREEPKRVVFDLEVKVRDSCGTLPRGSWKGEL